MLKITQLSPKGQITIPYSLRKLFNFQENSQVLIWPKIDSHQIIIKPVNRADLSELRGSVKAKRKPENWGQIREKVKKKIAKRIATGF